MPIVVRVDFAPRVFVVGFAADVLTARLGFDGGGVAERGVAAGEESTRTVATRKPTDAREMPAVTRQRGVVRQARFRTLRAGTAHLRGTLALSLRHSARSTVLSKVDGVKGVPRSALLAGMPGRYPEIVMIDAPSILAESAPHIRQRPTIAR